MLAIVYLSVIMTAPNEGMKSLVQSYVLLFLMFLFWVCMSQCNKASFFLSTLIPTRVCKSSKYIFNSELTSGFFFRLNFSLGKSLDKIAQLRENNKLPKPGKKKQKRTPKMNNIRLPEEVQEINKMKIFALNVI